MTLAAAGSALMVMARGSKIRSSLGMPQAAASSRIRRATASRPSAVGGMPPSSRVRATAVPPYFFRRGNTASMLSRLPLTEFTRGRPL